MPTIFTHPAVPLALRLGLGRARLPGRLLAVACIASVLPDIDVLAFRLGIPYSAVLGHRGLTHSIAFAVLIGLLAMPLHRWLGTGPSRCFGVVALATLSHGLLDACTNGGLGVALLWPLSEARYFFPWRPLEVSPIGWSRFVGPHGLEVLRSEALWVWLPAIALGLPGLLWRLRGRRRGNHGVRR